MTRRVVLASALGAILGGCSHVPDNQPIPPDERALRELAAAYRDFMRKNKRGPKDLKDLETLGQTNTRRSRVVPSPAQGMPNASGLVKSGGLVVQWGAPLLPAGESTEAVLAYLKDVPQAGGGVLMQDGETIKTMTADEFKVAPKAAVY